MFSAPHGHTVALIVVVVTLITYLSLVVGELVPKRIALTHPERVAAAVAGPMLMLSRIAAPAVWLLRHSTEAVLRLLGSAGGARHDGDRGRGQVADRRGDARRHLRAGRAAK